jgi:uncharacterized membrane protein HdeD (DUF308 family)
MTIHVTGPVEIFIFTLLAIPSMLFWLGIILMAIWIVKTFFMVELDELRRWWWRIKHHG